RSSPSSRSRGSGAPATASPGASRSAWNAVMRGFTSPTAEAACPIRPDGVTSTTRGGPMGIDPRLLVEQCQHTLERTDFAALGRRVEGKVRDSYLAGDRRTIVVTDRVSCFDRVVGTLPFKGQVLNQIAAFWFEATARIAPNHLISVPDPNVSLVRECRPLPVEFVMRAYLTGSTSTSIWTAYARGERVYCGHR